MESFRPLQRLERNERMLCKLSQANFALQRKSSCLLALLSCALFSFSCGQRKEVVQEVEEEQSSSSPSPASRMREKKGTRQKGPPGPGGTADPQASNQGPNQLARSIETSQFGQLQTYTWGGQIPGGPIVDWEPKPIAKIVNDYCALPCHGQHGKYSSKEYFLAEKEPVMKSMKGERGSIPMPPANLFANFRGSAEEAALLDWLKTQ